MFVDHLINEIAVTNAVTSTNGVGVPTVTNNGADTTDTDPVDVNNDVDVSSVSSADVDVTTAADGSMDTVNPDIQQRD